MSLAEKYVELLKENYAKNGKDFSLNEGSLFKIDEEQERKLLEKNIPSTLIDLLKIVSGDDQAVLGTYNDIIIPYRLYSSFEILNENTSYIIEYLPELYEYDDEAIDERIDVNSKNLIWFPIAEDSINNGGLSALYIDMTPSSKGTVGQIVMFLHDPDTFMVIADSFDEYLEKIIDSDFRFINEQLLKEVFM